MTIAIAADQIEFSDIRQTLFRGVLEGIGTRPEEEVWEVRLLEPEDGVDYAVEIRGPGGFNWSQRFFGPTELTEEFVRDSVASAVTEHTSLIQA